jgi:hypothetical protein
MVASKEIHPLDHAFEIAKFWLPGAPSALFLFLDTSQV